MPPTAETIVGTVTLTTSQSSVYEGGGAVYTLTRTGGPIGAGRSIRAENI